MTIDDKPGAFRKSFLPVAEREVNISVFKSYEEQGENLARFLVDDPAGAKVMLEGLRMIFEETEVTVVRLPQGIDRGGAQNWEQSFSALHRRFRSNPRTPRNASVLNPGLGYLGAGERSHSEN